MPWLVVRLTKGNAIDAARKLREANLEAYCPVETILRAHRGDPTKKLREQFRPLFPGYLFVNKDAGGTPEATDLDFVLGSKMAAHFMSFKDKWLLALDKDILHCREIEATIRQDALQNRTSARAWKPGDLVTILRGVLAGAMGTVLDVRRRNLFVAVKGKGALFVDVAMVK